jgi:hypothetical protein
MKSLSSSPYGSSVAGPNQKGSLYNDQIKKVSWKGVLECDFYIVSNFITL